MRRPVGILLGLAFAVLLLLRGRAEAACAQTTLSYTYAGNPRTACLYVNPGISSGTPVPLMVTVHGLNGNDDTFEHVTGMDGVSDTAFSAGHPFAVVYPETFPAGTGWDFINDPGYLENLITVQVPGVQAIDQTHVWGAGYSEGTYLVERSWACEVVPFVGIGNVAGNLNATILSGCTPPAGGVTFVKFHGTGDPVFPYNGGTGPGGTPVISALATALTWVGFNTMPQSVVGQPSVSYFPDTLNDGESVTDNVLVWACLTHTVTFYTIANGGHTWPGGTQTWPNTLGPTSQMVIASSIIWHALSGF
jgi:polyhydroxybutyrate depolymerase